jgi:hypothetical protein
MSWFDRPEGFVAKSFDGRAPSRVIETATHFVLTSGDADEPWDIASLSKAEDEAIQRRTERELEDQNVW